MAVDRERYNRLKQKDFRTWEVTKIGRESGYEKIDPFRGKGTYEERLSSIRRSRNTANEYNPTSNNRSEREAAQLNATDARQKSRDASTTGQTMDSRTRKRMKDFYYRQGRRANGLSVG